MKANSAFIYRKHVVGGRSFHLRMSSGVLRAALRGVWRTPLLHADADAAIRRLHNYGPIVGGLAANSGLHNFSRAFANGDH